MIVEIDPPTLDRAPQNGFVIVRQFAVRGEPALDRVAANAPQADGSARAYVPQGNGVEFTRMRVDFTRSPGRLAVRDGVVAGPAVGATFEGHVDFQREDVRLRGTFVPACAINNIPTQIPVLGMFLGGPKEGLLGVTYEVVGPPNGMMLHVNPMSVVAPGFLRQLFQFRHGDDAVVTGETTRQ